MKYGKKLLCLILVLASARVAQAETIEGLLAAGKLEARAIVQTPDPLFRKTPIVISVEVGTPNRFSEHGTRVRDFTVPGALVRPISTFAFNETRRRGGDTWAFQSWRFELFSERVGTLRTPAMTTFISVGTGTTGVVEGEVELRVPPLEIEAPPGTEGLDSWVAAIAFEVDESWEGILDRYQVGDAVTRIRRFTIKDAPAMAIPASPQVEIDGVQVYHAPARVDDKAVGGLLEGFREERVVFTIKAGGTHTIPEHRIHWFNLTTHAVEQIDLPGRTLDVSGTATPNGATTSEPRDETGNPVYWGLVVLGVALSYSFVRWIRWIRRTTWYRTGCDHLETWRGHRRARETFMRAAAQQDSRHCLALLYKRMSEHPEWQLSTACATDPQLRDVAAALMAHAYSDGQPPEASELQRLWEACTKPKEQRDNRNALRLNPGPSHWHSDSKTGLVKS